MSVWGTSLWNSSFMWLFAQSYKSVSDVDQHQNQNHLPLVAILLLPFNSTTHNIDSGQYSRACLNTTVHHNLSECVLKPVPAGASSMKMAITLVEMGNTRSNVKVEPMLCCCLLWSSVESNQSGNWTSLDKTSLTASLFVWFFLLSDLRSC